MFAPSSSRASLPEPGITPGIQEHRTLKISNKSGSSAEFQVGLGVATSTQRGAIGSVVRFLGAAAVDATVVALLTVAVVFAASSSSIASPKAWFYAGSGGYGNDLDTDGDGVPDSQDGCPTDARKVAPGECGCGGFEEDVDGDGDVDCALPSGTVRAWLHDDSRWRPSKEKNDRKRGWRISAGRAPQYLSGLDRAGNAVMQWPGCLAGQASFQNRF